MQDNKSIEELENDFWKDFEFPSVLVEKCYKYRRIPIRELSVEQIRLLIGQNIGLNYLLPLAVKLLKKDILVKGDNYPGDLLSSVLSIEVWPQLDVRKACKSLLLEHMDYLQSTENVNRKFLRQLDKFLDGDF